MKFDLGADILQETDQCKDDFSCLSGDKGCVCDAKELIADSLLVLKDMKYRDCNYNVLYGFSVFCA